LQSRNQVLGDGVKHLMDPRLSVIERAFQLADSGAVRSTDQIRKQLRKEGYSSGHLIGPSLLAQLRTRIRIALAKAEAVSD
jgi:hypothetical protein